MQAKTIGIIGGIGPESTMDYYKKIMEGYWKITNGNYPRIILNSIDMNQMLTLIKLKAYDALTEDIVNEIAKIQRAGAHFAVLASNTPHIIYSRLKNKSSLPVVSIIDATLKAVADSGVKKVCLWGTKFTMCGGFYQEEAALNGIEIITPNEEQQNFIHERYFDELVKGVFKNDTLSGYINIAQQIKDEHNIEGIILGGTELSKVIKQENFPDLKLFDTPELHVNKVLKYALND